MDRPRLIYYNDAHHFHAKRLDPPVSRHKLYQPVDELLGTGVDLLALGLGYGDVYFHQSKVGRTVGEHQDVWRNFIDWRIMRMVKDAAAMETDQVREAIARGREMGLSVFPSLKLQDPASGDSVWIDRFGLLKMKHGKSICLNEPDDTMADTDWCYDFSLELVREEQLAMVREMLDDYDADGIELDFLFRPRYFRRAEVEQNVPTMNRFVAEVRKLADDVGKRKGKTLPVLARVYHRRDENLKVGLDVEAWLEERSLDYVVGQVPYTLFETGLNEGRWLADAANGAGAAAYIRPPTQVYDERTARPNIEMFRALGQTLQWQGFTGMYLAGLPWPLSESEYQILREVAHPDAYERRSKRYILAPDEPGAYFDGPTDRQLPIELKEGVTNTLTMHVADDLDGAKQDGELRKPVLTIWFTDLCADDEIEIRFNDEVLSIEEAEVVDEGAAIIAASFRRDIHDMPGYNAYWYQFKLDPDILRRGDNTLEITTPREAKTAGFRRSVNIAEVRVRYKEFDRPEGLDPERLPIRW